MKIKSPIQRSIFIALLVFIWLYSFSFTLAQEKEATKQASVTAPSELEEKVKILKEKIATRVAEISKSNKNLLAGIVEKINDSVITIKTDGKTKQIAIDRDISNFYSIDLSKKKKIAIDIIEKDDYIVATGFILDSEFSANTILKQEIYDVLEGQITNVDREEFSLDIITTDKDQYIIDIEKDTSQKIMDPKKLLIATSGFSKYKIGDRIHFVIKSSSKKTNRYSALRTFIIPQELFTSQTKK